MSNMVRHIIKERFDSPDKRPGDFLDQAINDMASEKFLTVDFIAELAFGILFAAFESVSTTLTLAIKFLAENPLVLEELTVRVYNNSIKPNKPCKVLAHYIEKINSCSNTCNLFSRPRMRQL